MSTQSIPVFSLQDLKKGLQKKALLECVSKKGLFYLSDYGFDDTRHRTATNVGLDFFQNGSAQEKALCSNLDKSQRRGFSELEAESTATITNNGNYSDYSMCYSMGLSDNVFPNDNFKSIWSDYYNDIYDIARDTVGAVMSAAGVFTDNEEKFEEFMDCNPLLRLRYFPDVPEDRIAEKVPMRMAPHYDLSIVTLIQQFGCPNGFVSLHVEVDGELIKVPAVPNTILILCGAVAKIVSKGKILAPIHHVASPPTDLAVGSERTSMVFFLRPNSNFSFSVPEARKLGLDVCIKSEQATFGQWVGENYLELSSHNEPDKPKAKDMQRQLESV
ncbi:2OG-Fe(II) oxygenase family protein [Pseudoalteromonas umbrosa]|uniref:2OG-Fe(II) oxygenase family protein n=1 Tax=Pseudoalteromonas umbrosa TaxID=3048489 RepID=UPI0024C3E5F2|nr:2OG-Fe(II) oxygenase family protein [Pseudoalteromonas sp. B95]MDK1288222.1 2OG-Fe(II) oxygenase family protein [Pseudoalteromonas sp. B95]